jgi:hypothetical protein
VALQSGEFFAKQQNKREHKSPSRHKKHLWLRRIKTKNRETEKSVGYNKQ